MLALQALEQGQAVLLGLQGLQPLCWCHWCQTPATRQLRVQEALPQSPLVLQLAEAHCLWGVAQTRPSHPPGGHLQLGWGREQMEGRWVWGHQNRPMLARWRRCLWWRGVRHRQKGRMVQRQQTGQ